MEINRVLVKNNFIDFLKSKGIDREAFCRKTGYSKQNLSNFMRDKTAMLRMDFIAAILDIEPNFNVRWLFLGEGDMLLKDGEIPHDQTKQNLDALKHTIRMLLNENQQLKSELESK